jgi:hypothetical protein
MSPHRPDPESSPNLMTVPESLPSYPVFAASSASCRHYVEGFGWRRPRSVLLAGQYPELFEHVELVPILPEGADAVAVELGDGRTV